VITNPLKSNFFKDQIAAILIVGAFIAIGIILLSHMTTTGSTIDVYKASKNDTMRTNVSNFFKDVNASNLNIFSIIFSLFGAWVGAVLAFYFGAQSLERAHESLNKAQDNINQITTDNRLSSITVKEVLDKDPKCRDIKPFTLEDSVANIVKGAKEKSYQFVMIVNDVKNPTYVYGLLFMEDLKKDKAETDLEKETKKLKDFLDDPTINVIDSKITNQKWTSQEPGVQNFVSTTLDENLTTVQEKMKKKIATNQLSVRAVVFENNKATATITQNNLLSMIEKK
jgi:hypothetical protein